jgi:DNA-binding NarL/FixJ family response regulator
MSLSVLIVDDESAFRAHAERLLSLRGFRVIGQAGDGAGAMRLAGTLKPSAVLLDVNLPDADGVDVARRLAELPSPPRVLLTSADADVSPKLVSDCGAAAFIPKAELSESDLPALLAQREEAS